MPTVFCSHCGYVVARGDIADPEQAVRDRGLSACPGCGSREGIGWSPAELSEEELRSIAGSATQRLTMPDTSLEPLADRLAREAMRGRPSKTPGRWLLQIGLVMLVVGIAAGGFSWYRGEHWAWAIGVGVLAGFTAAWIADRFIASPDLD